MKAVYICSPVTGDINKNLKQGVRYAKKVYKQGYLPICVHAFLEKVTGLHESKGDREELLSLGLKYLDLCDEIWVFTRNGISKGMEIEIIYAKENNIEIKYIK